MGQGVIGYILLGLAVFTNAHIARYQPTFTRPAEEKKVENVPQDQWFNQLLDHYDVTNINTWKQRFQVIDEFYKQGGPAFLLVCSKRVENAKSIKRYALMDYAKQLNGIVFQIEHRFYGESKPTSDASLQSLRYLTVDQAVADAATFIDGMNAKYKLPEGTKWVTFGSSYGGILATWLREKYPHLVYASVAYSSTVQAKIDYVEFKDLVRDGFRSVSQECADSIQEGHKQLSKSLRENKDLSDINKKFTLCDPFEGSNEKDMETLFENIADNIGINIVFTHLLLHSKEDICNVLKNESIGNLLDRYAAVCNITMRDIGQDCLVSKYSKKIEGYKQESWDSEKVKSGERQFMYQTCTELGQFQPSENKSQLFSDDIKLSYSIQQCMDIFGDRFDQKFIEQGINRNNLMHGGQNNKATRAAYVFGKLDPFYPWGITKTKIPDSPAFFIEGEAFNTCVLKNKEKDSEVYKSACKEVEKLVSKWVKE